jgi:UDP-N-acetylmuramoylalanine--D-glutamate ligase
MKSPQELTGKSICIIGYGVEGRSSLSFLYQYGAHVTVADVKKKSDFSPDEIKSWESKGITFSFELLPNLSEFDYIVRSPGVPVTILESQNVSKEKTTTATQLFFDYCPAKIIGVTGTKGKGTTSSLIYEMLKTAGRQDVFLGGNIGKPPLDFLNEINDESIVVLELSSFQLLDLHSSPHIAVMLMITSEHLDFHKDVYEYVEAKRNILKFQKTQDHAILNKDYPATNESDLYTDAQLYYVSRDNEVEKGCFVKDNTVILRLNGTEEKVINTEEIVLPGKHNWENVCASVIAANLAGVEIKTIREVLKTFKGLEHRLELVNTVRGVKYYDDSFSTTPETAIAAIEAFEDPKILILGGSSKNSDFTELGKVISESESIKAIIGIGEEWERIKAQIPNSKFQIPIIEDCKNMEEIVQKASEIGEVGDVVILSPACASFDMFIDYKDRGSQFKAVVNNL